ncbi:ATP-dependent DNA ligase [soil metagenome]
MPQGIEPSNLQKVYWPQAGLTKGDLLAYFDEVAACILPALRDRPLTVVRYPDGVEGGSFYQKNTPSYAPEWVRTIRLRAESAHRDVAYTVCNTKRTLLWLANQGAIEFHPFQSRIDRIDRPDYMFFDMDPPGGRFDLAVEAAFVAREVLAGLRLSAIPKTSGAKGVHVCVPIQRRYDYRRVRSTSVRIAERIEEAAPQLATTEFKKAERGARVLVDVARNAFGAHTATVYSPRPRPEASVSFPVPWEELGAVRPEDFTIRTVPALLGRSGDRWRDLMPRPQALPHD